VVLADLGWAQAVPAAGLAAAVTAEVVLSRRAGPGPMTVRSAARWAAAYASLAVLFGLATAAASSWTAAGQFYAGYLTEYSLSLDNLFIFYVIMTRLAVPAARQQRVLMAGIALALVLRTVLIMSGIAAVSHAAWLFYPLGALLLWTGAGLLRGHPGGTEDEEHARLLSWLERRVGRAAGNPDGGTAAGERAPAGTVPVLVLAAAIGIADLLFAFDSIPAVFGITTSAVLIVACNAFALMGLRQLYVLLTRVLGRLTYLNHGLAVICAFIGVKLLLQALQGSGARWAPEIPAWLSLLVVVTVLLVTVAASLPGARRAAGEPAAAGSAAGPLTSSQRAVLSRRFAVLDANRDGTWQLADYERQARELCDACGHALDSPPARAVAAGQRALFSALLTHMDANGDQQISPDEFAAAVGRPVEDRPRFDAAVAAAARSLIQAADHDRKGVLDPPGYARLTAAYGASAEQAARAFARLDLDRNGVLDAAELTAAITQFFTSPDPDAPGNLAFGRL
jgi:TerC family integral membrane protein